MRDTYIKVGFGVTGGVAQDRCAIPIVHTSFPCFDHVKSGKFTLGTVPAAIVVGVTSGALIPKLHHRSQPDERTGQAWEVS